MTIALAATLGLAACGTRVSGDDLSTVVGAGGGVTSPESLGSGDSLTGANLSGAGGGGGSAGDGSGLGADPGDAGLSGDSGAGGGVPGVPGPGGGTDGNGGEDPAAPGGDGDTPDPQAPGGGETGPLKVGIVYAEGVNEAAAALGLNISTGDAKAQTKAMADYLNSQGGVAGREVEIVLYDVSRDSGTTPSVAYDRACQSLSQDGDVDFMISYAGMTTGNMKCFADAGIGVIHDISTLPDSAMQQYSDYFAAPGDFGTGRMLGEMIDRLWATGWLTKTSIIGSFAKDTTDHRALVDGPMTQALARHGLKIAVKQSVSDDASGISQASAVELQFAANRVDRIISINNPLFVMQAASTQGYRPQYALYTTFGPGALMESTAPRDQLVGAAGIGWSPALDIGRGKQPGPVSPNETLCLQIMQKSGQVASGSVEKSFQLILCNSFLYLAYAADKVGSAPSNLAGLAGKLVGTSFRPADTFGTDMRSRADGAAAYRDLTYQTGCSCFQYGAMHTAG